MAIPREGSAPGRSVDDVGTFGDLLRWWRAVRSMSQLDLAVTAATTPRHLSFLETGRSQPSRDMVLRLATALDVPLRDRNGLLLAAGFAPRYSAHPLDDPALDRVQMAVQRMLAQHDPLPAVLMDRSWNLLDANDGARRLFAAIGAPEDERNVLRLFLQPGPVKDAVANWSELAPALVERARREAVGGVLDAGTADLVRELGNLDAPRSTGPVIDVELDVDGRRLRFFSVVSTIGTPADVTAQELRVETFFPADEATAGAWS